MKKLLCLMLALLMLSCLASCSSDVPDGFQQVSGKNDAFDLYIPLSWAADSSENRAGGYYETTTNGDRSNVSFACTFTYEDIINVKDYMAKLKEDLAATFPDFNVEKESADVDYKIGGDSICYTCTVSGVKYKFYQLVTFYGGNYYTFTYTSTPENYDKHLEEVDLILQYIDFKG